MIKVITLKSFNAVELTNRGPRRGFIVPFIGPGDDCVMIADTDKSANHETIADDFIALKENELFDAIKEQENITPEEKEKTYNFCLGLQKEYKRYEKEYPTSRKDFLLYEDGAVAFDASSPFGKFILYRDSSRGFSISRRTDNIVCEFLNNRWKGEPIPENNKCAGQQRFF